MAKKRRFTVDMRSEIFFAKVPLEVLIKISKNLDNLTELDAFCKSLLPERSDKEIIKIWFHTTKQNRTLQHASWTGLGEMKNFCDIAKRKIIAIEEAAEILANEKDNFPNHNWRYEGTADKMRWLGKEQTLDSSNYMRK